MPSANDVARWFSEVRVLDGGFGTEAEIRSDFKISGHKAWSCMLLQNDPSLVVDIHKSYLNAGCDVISTNTYQASPETLAEALKVEPAVAKALMTKAVTLAKRAVKEFWKAGKTSGRLYPLIAGSLGPYGACLADGSEYTGSYADKMSENQLMEFHLKRAEILVAAGVDLLAWETIPSEIEATAITRVMQQLPANTVAWLSVSTPNGQTTAHGEPLHKVAAAVNSCDPIIGVGVNCQIPHELIGQGLTNVSGIQIWRDDAASSDDGYYPHPDALHKTQRREKTKILIAYANSGEKWLEIPLRRSGNAPRGYWVWPMHIGPNDWAGSVSRWAINREMLQRQPELTANEISQRHGLAQWIGGCCRVRPNNIEQLARIIKPDEFSLAPTTNETNLETDSGDTRRVQPSTENMAAATIAASKKNVKRTMKRRNIRSVEGCQKKTKQ